MTTIPALVRARDDAEALELALIENMAREDLSPIEEARACAALVEELGLTREQVGRRVGRSRVAVSNLIRLLDLPDEVIELLQEGAFSEGHGRALLLAEDHTARRRLARAAVGEGWSVRVRGARSCEQQRRRRREGRRRAAPRAGGPPRSARGRAGDRRGAVGSARGRGVGTTRPCAGAIAPSCGLDRARRRWSSRSGCVPAGAAARRGGGHATILPLCVLYYAIG